MPSHALQLCSYSWPHLLMFLHKKGKLKDYILHREIEVPALVPWLRIGWMSNTSTLWLCMVASEAVSDGLIAYTSSVDEVIMHRHTKGL